MSHHVLARSGDLLFRCCLTLILVLAAGLAARADDFRITGVQVTNGNVRVDWNAPGGSNYVVQTTVSVPPGVPTNFTDLSPAIGVPGSGVVSTGYTHVGGQSSEGSRFYRVRAYALPAQAQLQIQPTNAIIAPGMTNRFRLMLQVPGNPESNVTAYATWTVLTNIAGLRGVSNDFAYVKGLGNGLAQVRAAYQGMTNTQTLRIATLTGIYSDPASFPSDYVNGAGLQAVVMGLVGTQMVNLSPASSLANYSPGITQVRYEVRADVANSYALISGIAAAQQDGIYFLADTNVTSSFKLQWCDFTDAYASPSPVQVLVGQTQQVAVVGLRANGATVNAFQFVNTSFPLPFDDGIARVQQAPTLNPQYFQVIGLAPGFSSVPIEVVNNSDCGSFFRTLSVQVVAPPGITSQPVARTVTPGIGTTFQVVASGSTPLNYQWQRNGANLPAATASTLAFSNPSFVDDADYRVIVSNNYGSVTSLTARLTVAVPGVPLWTNWYNGPANGYDSASALALDASGNVVVAGRVSDALGYSDYGIVKYAASGVPLWTNLYSSIGNNYDTANAVTTDGSGNAFVTGSSAGAGNSDIVTLKYSSGGTPIWTNRYNGPGNGFDSGNAIATDGIGNVFVTGMAQMSSGNSDIVTLKYANAGGALWTNRYNGPGSGNDSAQAIAVDPSSNVLVAGYATVSGGTYDFATIKYANNGGPSWTNRYNGPGNSSDTAQAIAVDSSRNVFVAGTVTLNGFANAFATLKYASNGVPAWTNFYKASATSFDSLRSLGVDDSGNVFATGYSVQGNNRHEWTTIKYSNAGVPLWTNRFKGPGDGEDAPAKLAVDGQGHVLITGVSTLSPGQQTATTLKYLSTGELAWVHYHQAPGGSYAYAIKVNAAGDAYVTGNATVGGSSDFVTLKYCSGTQSANDQFESAMTVANFPTMITANNSCASKEPGEPNHFGNAGGKSLWWNWTAPFSTCVTLKTCGSDYDTLLAVYTGSSLGTLSVIASNDDSGLCLAGIRQSQVQFQALAGQTYRIAVDGYFNGAVTFAGNIVLTLEPGAPPNDDFANAVTLTGLPVNTGGNSFCATKQAGEPSHAGNAGGRSLWWNWTAPSNVCVKVQTCGSDFDTLLAVYTGNAVNTLTPVAANNDSSECGSGGTVWFSAVAGTTYHIAVDGNNMNGAAASGGISLTIEGGLAANDSFVNPNYLSGSATTVFADNTCATKEAGEPNHAANAGGKSLWWLWTAPADGCVTLKTCGSGFDTLLGVYTGTNVSALSQVATNDDTVACGGPAFQSQVQFLATAGTAYRIAVDGYRHPTDLTVAAGSVMLDLYQGPPLNDDFTNRTVLTGSSATTIGYNVCATKQAGEPNHADNTGGKSLWWSWTAPASGRIRIYTCGSDFDTLLAVYTGTAVDTLSLVDKSDDSNSCGSQSVRSYVQFNASAGVTYQIAVDGYRNPTTGVISAGNILLNIQP